MPPIEHLLRLGTHAEREYLEMTPSWFDAVVVNANLVQATAAATAVFAVRTAKPYVIDPVTYAFGLDPALLMSKARRPGQPARVRSTFAALADAYGLPADRIGRRSLRAEDFEGQAAERIATAVLTFQRVVLRDALGHNAAFLTSLENATVLPRSYFSPYFVNDGSAEWLETNARFAQISAQLAGDESAAVLAYDSRAVSDTQIGILAAGYAALPAADVFVWPGDLDEHSSSETSLAAYADLVKLLSDAGKAPTAAYGGFFAMLLAFRGLKGVCHGVGYGDKRDLEPLVGGGLPPVRYYLRGVRDGIPMGEVPIVAEGLTDEDFREYVCECTICTGLLQRGGVANLIAAFNETEPRVTPIRGITEVATSRVYRMARFHFLENRNREIHDIRAAETFDVIRARLATDAAWVSDRLGARAVQHIQRWIAAADPNRPVA